MDFWTFVLIALLAVLATISFCMWAIAHHNRKLFTAMKKFVVERLPEIRVRAEEYQRLRTEVLADGKVLLESMFGDDPDFKDCKVEAWCNLTTASRLFDDFDYKQLRRLGLTDMVEPVLNGWPDVQDEKLNAYRAKVDRLRDEIKLIREVSEINIE